MDKWPIGVFASIDAGLGVHLEVAQDLGVPTVQIHTPHKQNRNPAAAEKFLKRCEKAGIRVTAVFGGFDGDSYADIPTTAHTVGLVPEATRAARVQEMKEIADFARALDCSTVALHVGFVPSDRSGASYRGLLDATRDLLDHIAANGQHLNLETGQEPAEHLLTFMTDVKRENLFINFDPANMILYGRAIRLRPLSRSGHLCGACIARTQNGPLWKPAANSGGPKCRSVKAMSEWNSICELSTVWDITAPLRSNARFLTNRNGKSRTLAERFDCSSRFAPDLGTGRRVRRAPSPCSGRVCRSGRWIACFAC